MQPCGKYGYYCPVCHCGHLLYFWQKAVNILHQSKVFESTLFAKHNFFAHNTCSLCLVALYDSNYICTILELALGQ